MAYAFVVVVVVSTIVADGIAGQSSKRTSTANQCFVQCCDEVLDGCTAAGRCRL